MNKLYMTLLCFSLLFIVACNEEQKLPNGYIEITQEKGASFILEGYQDTQLGFVPFQANGFASSIYIKDQKFCGKNYSFAPTWDTSDAIPQDYDWLEETTIKEKEYYWARYKEKTLYRFIWIRVAYVSGNEVGIEYVISNHTETIPNANANTQENACGLEIPHLNSKHTYAAHYVEANGKQIMNIAVEWVAEKKHANWVAFSFNPTTAEDNVSRTDKWSNDPILQPNTDADYWNNFHKSDGFDKGHLCASEDRVYMKEANWQTFYYSNMSPQFNSFNGGFWQKLENKVQTWGRSTISGRLDHVYVAKGGTVNELIINHYAQKKGSDGQWPNTDENGLTKGGLACPKYYFMAILAEKGDNYQAIAFWVEHREDLPSKPTIEDLQACTISIDELESKTGIDFFCNLPDELENEVETRKELSAWQW